MNVFIEPTRDQWPQLIQRPELDVHALESTVSNILQQVKNGGDESVRQWTEQFGGSKLPMAKIAETELVAAEQQLSKELRVAIQVAKENITQFHAAQQENTKVIETMPGVQCWRKSIGIERVGLYIPGGTAPLFSTLLMLGIPAKLAGCSKIVVCTPADKTGQIHPAILYTAHLLGITDVFPIGGAQAIAAMAYGTETVPAVYKIFGPGNQYVTCAKQLVNRDGIAIDMPAGPSEVAVYADESAFPEFVAADLLSQAEHGVDSQVLLVATSLQMVEQVQLAIAQQVQALPRAELANQALQNSRALVLQNTEYAFDLLNAYAPEHLIIASNDFAALASKVINAGSVFLGHYAPESAGDYASGTNHTLPTNGYARMYAGVSLDSFVKKITFQQISQQGIQLLGPTVMAMAEAEGLEAHRNAVQVRVKPSTSTTQS